MNGVTKIVLWLCAWPLLLVGCDGGSSGDRPESIIAANVNGMPSLTKVYTYQYTVDSEQILTCSKLFLVDDSCELATIRPLGAGTSNDISLSDIKSRLVVSHDWMAESFIAALEKINDQDFLNLFKSINTIVISYDVRPSFYHRFTASIYIDPRYLWRNSYEWETLFKQDDYRSVYQREFIFDSFLRYVDSDSSDYITWSNSYDADSYNARTLAQITPGLFKLLVHELAHANDFLPSEVLRVLGDRGKIYDDYIYPGYHINDELLDTQPWASELLYEAAQIAFRGKAMTDRIKTTSAAQAGSAFASDGVADFYGYSTHAEDVAMLFEAFMMYKKYGAVSDVAFVLLPTEDDYSCDDFVVKWGQRNRLADEKVQQRAMFIASRILARDTTADLSSIPSAPTAMETDIGWCSSRTIAQTDQIRSRLLSARQPVVHDYRDDRIRY